LLATVLTSRLTAGRAVVPRAVFAADTEGTDVLGTIVYIIANRVVRGTQAPFRRVAFVIGARNPVVALRDAVRCHRAQSREIPGGSTIEGAVANVAVIQRLAILIPPAQTFFHLQFIGRQQLSSTLPFRTKVGSGTRVAVVAFDAVGPFRVMEAFAGIGIA